MESIINDYGQLLAYAAALGVPPARAKLELQKMSMKNRKFTDTPRRDQLS